MHSAILLCLGLVFSVSILVLIAQKIRIAYPIFLAIAGIVVGFIPMLPTIGIDPELVFLVILPPILYEAAQSISLKELWKWRRIISVMAIGFVFFTTVTVACISHWLIPGFSWQHGFLLGAIISPPDAAAATTVLKYVKIPKGIVSILEGESLPNDATSLTIFRFSLAAIATSHFTWHEAAGGFAFVVVFGVAIGLAFGFIFNFLLKRLPANSELDIAFSLVIPHVMYITAESLHSSGVLAVVSGGLLIAYKNHFDISHSSRLKAGAIWTSLVFILNAVIFFLIGLQLPSIVNDLKGIALRDAIIISIIITIVITATRLFSGILSALFTRFISRYITVAQAAPGWRNPAIVGWVAMRGVVSLASAMSIPVLLTNGEEFPHRSLILFVTFFVTIVTLVGQGLMLPWLVKVVKPQELSTRKTDDVQMFEMEAQLSKVAVDELEQHHAKTMERNFLVKHKFDTLRDKVEMLEINKESEEGFKHATGMLDEFNKVMHAVATRQRQELHKFRRMTDYDDNVIKAIETKLDLEEEKLGEGNGH
ncbi:Na+/H+ antiporter [Pseudochryseolinea flava]|uniref:Na+/H+ antiporter n=1 Tax=Pseudochryseolinea flava TaxID=2059302 RepID=A0A364Y1C5_9BACT|nr:Na+/H+ antiporter [Pseudochryseolinea flava]RAW00641.1 Na+/H+ antiporter [Pseudochryseolinea flava]